MTKIIGKHTTKFGYELLRTTYDSLIESFPSGRYFMGGTELPFTPNTGNAFASFLLGLGCERTVHARTGLVGAAVVFPFLLFPG